MSKDVPSFTTFFLRLIEEWENERRKDDSMSSAENLTRPLWGGSSDATPYMDLDLISELKPFQIIDAIKNYISEFYDSSAIYVMDAWVKCISHESYSYSDLPMVIEMYEAAAFREYRPDIEDCEEM